MPWHALSRPSLPVEVLRSACAERGLPVPVAYHGGLRFAEFLLDRSDGRLGPPEYHAVAEAGWTHALGDWVFAGALHGAGFGREEMLRYAGRRGLAMGAATAMREYAAEFVDLVVDELIAQDAELVGFTTTFMQNVPSLAVARRLKQRRPEVTVLFGGGNCDGPMGAALHREFGFLDLVLRGEADETFPLLLRGLAGGPDAALAEVPGLCWRNAAGQSRVNSAPARLVPPAAMAAPDFDDWFARFDASGVSAHVEPELVVESARGCWWGERHHCTFCGLNGTSMAFRAKPSGTFTAELGGLIRRHKTLDVVVVDNILEPGYLRTVLPDLAACGWDAHLHYEVKANLTTEQVGVLAAAGVHSVQPGIESLVDDVLTRMDKGVRAVHNVRTMRDCESARLEVSWNWLYGFPGESPESYRAVLDQVPALVHLQPPTSAARIQLNRFSPYFESPELGFAQRWPAEPYRYVYDVPPGRLGDLVYLFETPDRGLSEEQAAALHDAAASWARDHPSSSLHRIEAEGCLVLRDRRAGWPRQDFVLEEPRERAAWAELEHGRSLTGLARALAGYRWDPEDLARWLGELRERGLVFTASGRWVALATADIPAAEALRPGPGRLRLALA
jgi:ribosomal peptide maturation radical SAM protein 1